MTLIASSYAAAMLRKYLALLPVILLPGIPLRASWWPAYRHQPL